MEGIERAGQGGFDFQKFGDAIATGVANGGVVLRGGVGGTEVWRGFVAAGGSRWRVLHYISDLQADANGRRGGAGIYIGMVELFVAV